MTCNTPRSRPSRNGTPPLPADLVCEHVNLDVEERALYGDFFLAVGLLYSTFRTVARPRSDHRSTGPHDPKRKELAERYTLLAERWRESWERAQATVDARARVEAKYGGRNGCKYGGRNG